MLLRNFDETPSLSAEVANDHWINDAIESFLTNAKKHDIENINVIFQFAIDIAARAPQIPLCALTHHALKSKRQKIADDTTNVMFETTLELIQNINASENHFCISG